MAVTQVAAKLSERLELLYGASFHGLWFLRYSCRGEHLKVRIHADIPVSDLLANAQALADSFLVEVTPAAKAERPANAEKSRPTPVDLEDRGDHDHPDRSFQISRYQRSEVHFGPEPWPQDDLHVARTCAVLSASAQVICDLTPGLEGDWPHKFRQTTLWKLIIAALGVFSGDLPRLQSYLSYHRHWLIQYVALGSPNRARTFLGKLEEKRLALGESARPLEQSLAKHWLQSSAPEPSLQTWVETIRALIAHAETHHGDSDYLVDPITTDVRFAPLFKVLHGAANQLGLLQRDEALAYTILMGCLDAATQPANLSKAC